jgi:hypothetical protein
MLLPWENASCEMRWDQRDIEDVDRFRSTSQAVAGLSVIGGWRCPVAMSN